MPQPQRRSDIDWLRVFATLLLFVFHVNKVFDVAPFYHIKNAEQVLELNLFSLAVHFWHMPLFFVLAGWSSHLVLSRKGDDTYVAERLRRLLIPTLVAIVIICPWMKYYELRSGFDMGIYGYQELAQPYTGSFLEFLPTFFTDIARFTWSHLWFVVYLLTFSLLYRKWMMRRIATPGRFTEVSSSALWKPLFVLCGIQMTLRLIWPGAQNLVNDWANFTFYSTFFLLGFVLGLVPRWQEEIDRQRWRALGVVAVTHTILLVYWVAKDGEPWPQEAALVPVLQVIPILGITAIAGYAVILAMLGFAHRHWQRSGPALAYLSEASMPIYILHQAAIVIPGFYIVRSDLGFTAKYVALLVVSITTTLLVYHFVVRRVGWVRPLFGLKSSDGQTAASAAVVPVPQPS